MNIYIKLYKTIYNMDLNQDNGIEFSDSEDDNHINHEVAHKIQENTEDVCRGFKTYLSTPLFINKKNDPSTNIVDRYTHICYNIPEKYIPKCFKFMEMYRRKKLKFMIYEKQQEYSGIMLDFDIKQSMSKTQIDTQHYHRLCSNVFELLYKYLQIETGKKEFYVAFTKKPKVVYSDEKNYYKDGLHMIIPNIKVTREFKRFFIDKLVELGTIEKIFKDVIPLDGTDRSSFIDKNSAHVGVHFIGSATKPDTPPYDLNCVFKVQTIGSDDIIPVVQPDFDNNNTNVCYEFSLNWEKPSIKNGIVVKTKYQPQIQFMDIIDKYKRPDAFNVDDDDDDCYGDLSILGIHDANSKFIKELLDMLHPKRASDYSMWFDVICALAHTSQSYKSLAEYFSRKCPDKFNISEFEKTWNSILIKKNTKLSISSLHYWAKTDNPDRYEEVRNTDIYKTVVNKCYDSRTEGILEHFDVAEVLYASLKDKFVYDRDENGGTWYEFIIEGDQCKNGELFKWRRYKDRPNSLMLYMSINMPVLFKKVLDYIKSQLKDATQDALKWQYVVYKNFQRSCRSLCNSGFKRGVAVEAEQLFEQMGFYEKLDADPNIIGVSNGVLRLSKKCELKTGHHGHLVSKFTPVQYKPFNPNDPYTKRVIIALRNLFPDDEPDTFDFIMHYLASTLDGHKKESIMLFLVGKGSNGKSFIVELHKGAIGANYAVKMPISFLTSKAKDAETATPALMQLKDAHFAYYSESNRCEILNVAKIKEFTGQETMAGRALHKDYVNFKPKCHHLVSSNNDFEIPGTDHGTWRRIVYSPMKIKFCNVSTDTYDKRNKYERIADPSLGTNWTEDPDILSAYLSLIVYYYESLSNKYNGKVMNVPHPHITKDTEEFRNRQDTVNNFLALHLVKCQDENYIMSLLTVKDRYIKWYDSMFTPDKDVTKGALGQLENSKLQSYVKKTQRGKFIVGYKVLDIGEFPAEGDKYYNDVFINEQKNKTELANESAIDFHARLCKEYDAKQAKEILQPDCKEKKEEYDYDSDIDDIIAKTKKAEPRKIFKSFKEPPSVNFDKNGFKLPNKISEDLCNTGFGSDSSDSDSD